MTEQWKELKETITELRDNDGTGAQQEVCKFLVNLMDVLEKQMSNDENPKMGEWIHPYRSDIACECSVCHMQMPITDYFHYCPNCGAKMKGGEE